MSEDKQFAQKLIDLLQQHVNLSSQQVPSHQRKLSFSGNANDRNSLNLDNANSFALFQRNSIERGIPLTKNMLSEDMYMKDYSNSNSDSQPQQSYEQKQQRQQQKQQQPFMILQDEQQWLVDELDLNKPITKRKKVLENTKNVLRNFGNAQNQYALYNKDAKIIVQNEISDPQSFYQWVRQLKLENFQGFKGVWMEGTSHKKIFRRLYKKLCWKFYTETSMPYVLTSRMRDHKTKMSHLKYIFRFLQGLKNPQDFSYFKKVEK